MSSSYNSPRYSVDSQNTIPNEFQIPVNYAHVNQGYSSDVWSPSSQIRQQLRVGRMELTVQGQEVWLRNTACEKCFLQCQGNVGR